MESIEEMLERRKGEGAVKGEYLHNAILIAIVILTAVGSFGLGYLSGADSNQKELYVEEKNIDAIPASVYATQQKEQEKGKESKEGAVVGSVNSDKYHYPWCSGAQRIKDENKVYFASIEEARNNGYTPAGNCKGLE